VSMVETDSFRNSSPVEIMMSGAMTDTKFLAWGQAAYNIHGTGRGVPGGIELLFAISDRNKQWLAWYSYKSFGAGDTVIATGGNYAHDLLAHHAPFPSHFKTHKTMRVDELAGPYMESRGRYAQDFAGSNIRGESVAIVVSSRPTPGRLGFMLGTKPGALGKALFQDTPHNQFVTLHLYFKSAHTHKAPIPNSTGPLRFLMVEPFSYPEVHVNKISRMRFFEREYMLTK
jgi:hypothetical protein